MNTPTKAEISAVMSLMGRKARGVKKPISAAESARRSAWMKAMNVARAAARKGAAK